MTPLSLPLRSRKGKIAARRSRAQSPPTRRPRASANRADLRVRPSRGEPACPRPLRTADAVSLLRETHGRRVFRLHPPALARPVRVAVALRDDPFEATLGDGGSRRSATRTAAVPVVERERLRQA